MYTCRKCHGLKHIVFGILLLVNAFVWPMWLGIDGWVKFIAAVMVLFALFHLFVPNKCMACNVCCQPATKKKGKK